MIKKTVEPRELILAILHAKPAEFVAWVKSEHTGITNLAYQLGERMTESDVSLAEAAEAKLRDTGLDLARRKIHTDETFQIHAIKQYFNEAIKFYRALREARIGVAVSIAAKEFGVDTALLSSAVHTRT